MVGGRKPEGLYGQVGIFGTDDMDSREKVSKEFIANMYNLGGTDESHEEIDKLIYEISDIDHIEDISECITP